MSPAPRPGHAGRRGGGTGSTLAVDQQTLRIRQGVAAGAALLVVILLVVGIKGCLSSAKKRSLRDYNRNVASLIQQSDRSVGKAFFDQLSGAVATGGGSPLNLETQVNQLRVVSEDLVKRARRLDVPDDMRPAQSNFVLVLELRRDALRKIATKLPLAQASSNAAATAVTQITGQMQAFLASDIIYSQRVIPYIKRALDKNGIGGQTIATSQFLPSISWLDEQTVASRLGAAASGRTTATGPAAPGSHGHALSSVSVGGTDLDSSTANHIPAGSNLSFDVTFANQGENNETNVVVKLSITGSGRPVTAQTTVPQTSASSDATATIPLTQAPPIGVPVTITVSVDPVPGEKTTDNNKQTYPAIFERQ